MAQEDYVIADQTGVSFLADLNNTLAAIVSNNSGATEPATMYAYQMWADTNAGILKQRNSANNAWINILTLAGIKSSDIRNTPAGSIAATTVQAALNELDTEKAALAGATFTGPATSLAGDFNLVSNAALSDAAATLTVTALINGEFTITPTVARILTLDTAANIISALSGSINGSNFKFTIVNLAAFDVTLATASGLTLVGNMIVNNGSATFRVRRLSGTTVSVTRLDKESIVQVISKEFQSGEQTITSGGLITFAHGLGEKPKLIEALLVCKTAEAGYSIDDEIYVPASPNSISNADDKGVAILRTSTTLVLRFGNNAGVFDTLQKNGGTSFGLSNTSWRFLLRAYA